MWYTPCKRRCFYEFTAFCEIYTLVQPGIVHYHLPAYFCHAGAAAVYQALRPLGRYGAAAIMIGFYCCVPAVLYALSCMERLVRNILKEDVFVAQNVRFLRRIRWCCAAVSGICLPAAFFYPPLIFMTTIMAFLALAVSVVKNVMAAAVEIREENDLTV